MKIDKHGIQVRRSEMPLWEGRLKKGLCGFCGKEKTITPGMNLGEKCMTKAMELNGIKVGVDK